MMMILSEYHLDIQATQDSGRNLFFFNPNISLGYDFADSKLVASTVQCTEYIALKMCMFFRNPPVHDPFGFGDADRLPGHVGFVEYKQYNN